MMKRNHLSKVQAVWTSKHKLTRCCLRLLSPLWLTCFAVPGHAQQPSQPPKAPVSATRKIDFNRDIRPLLSDRCFHCHGPDSDNQTSDLRLDTAAGLFADLGGYHAIVPGELESSELHRRIHSDDPAEIMPPPEAKRSLDDAEVALIDEWIRQGAAVENHWSLVPPVRPPLPEVRAKDWPQNPIDFFVLHELEAKGWSPSPAADRTTLLRRVTLDLTGLPPSRDETDSFLEDHGTNAYERVVDRLLASPRYGERMALPWLDAARYADSAGYQNDFLRSQWPWRDWVVERFNDNQPFDQFSIEQLAGDLLPNSTNEQRLATAFNRNHRINNEGGIIPEEFLVEYVADRVETTGTVWMGMTIGCARCHDHKYDPISQRDFYRMFAFFHNIPEKGKDGSIAPAPNMAVTVEGAAEAHAQLAREVETLETSLGTVGLQSDQSLQKRLADAKSALEKFETENVTYVSIMQEMDTPRDTYLLVRGAYDAPDESCKLTPGTPTAILAFDEAFPANRLGLARWLFSDQHPLVARVAVNRFWQNYFGSGIVKTSEDFGSQGEPPSHPDLLDWLAVEFRESGWDVKALQKQIVMSATYRQSSVVTPQRLRQDPENRWLARGARFRLYAQAIRDQALAASGLLVGERGGPPVMPYQPEGLWDEVSAKGFKYIEGKEDELYRRSMYTFWRRTVPPPAMMNFDAPSRETCSVSLTRTNTPLQAMNLLNDPTYVEAARGLAGRMMREGGDTIESQIDYGMKCLLGSCPAPAIRNILVGAYTRYLDYFHQQPQAAQALIEVGAQPPDASLDPVGLAARTTLASVMLNLDVTVTKQ